MLELGWQDLASIEREREYSPSSCIGGDYKPFVRAYSEKSLEARATCASVLGLRYGSRPAQTLDLFKPKNLDRLSPVVVFLHGGYWQELSKDDSSFPAARFANRDISYAAVDYTLAPHASLVEIITECREAIAWLYLNGAGLGIDVDRIIVAGSSAGAHLAAMTCLNDWKAAAGLPPDAIKAAILVSGIYALEPLIGTSINDAVGLTVDEAKRTSPIDQDLGGFPPSIVCWGENETDQFKRQSQTFAAALRINGTSCTTFEAVGRNHFDIILDLADPTTEFGSRVLSFVDPVKA